MYFTNRELSSFTMYLAGEKKEGEKKTEQVKMGVSTGVAQILEAPL